MEKKLKIGTKVKVVLPCRTSTNKKGLIGYITETQKSNLADFELGSCYRVCKKKNCNHSKEHPWDSKEYDLQGWWENESGLKIIK